MMKNELDVQFIASNSHVIYNNWYQSVFVLFYCGTSSINIDLFKDSQATMTIIRDREEHPFDHMTHFLNLNWMLILIFYEFICLRCKCFRFLFSHTILWSSTPIEWKKKQNMAFGCIDAKANASSFVHSILPTISCLIDTQSKD